MSNEVFIISGCRTAIGNFQGQFDKFPASELGSTVIAELIKRASLEPKEVDQVIMGHVLTAGQGQNPARQAAIGAKIPYETPAYCVNMLCGSGLKSVFLGYQAIRNKDCEIVIAGGQESMTRAHHSAYIRGNKLGPLHLGDTLLQDGLTDAFNNVHMGLTAEHLTHAYKVTREAQDQFALESQRRAQKAIESGFFKAEIVPILEKRTLKVLDRDEFVKMNSTIEALAKLRPAFDAKGSVTAGNASGISDGAAGVVLAGGDSVKKRDLKPLARIVAFAEAGVDPMKMGLGPITAVAKVLQKAGWKQEEVELFELNEAFAVQSLIVLDQLKLDANKVNVTGGAIALGHPIGASGTRVLVTLIYNLERLNKRKGIASLCIGGGMGIAIAIERCL